MDRFIIPLDDAAAALFRQVARQAGRTPEQVIADALFLLAGELSAEALRRKAE